MANYSTSGQDKISIKGRPIIDIAFGEAISIDFPNDLMEMSTGKNGNTVYAKKESNVNADVKIRVNLGSPDDKFLLSEFKSSSSNFAGYTLLTGIYTKFIGDGFGNITNSNIILEGGFIKKQPKMFYDTEGNTEQAIHEYEFKFAIGTTTM